MDVSLAWEYCASSGLWWANHLSRGVLPSVCRSVIEVPHRGGLGPLGVLSHRKRSFNTIRINSLLVVVNESHLLYVSRQKCGMLFAIDRLTLMKNKTHSNE
jgi:hypothetical protein